MNNEKTDSKLGLQVYKHLEAIGCHTPMKHNSLTDPQKVAFIEDAMRSVLQALELDITDDSLEETPKRIAKMFVYEIFSGLSTANFPKCTTVQNKMDYNDLIIEKATVKSVCEHHFVYFGTSHNSDLGCWVAYIPNKKIVGLSKINRIVEYFSRRPQIQERLTHQIAETLKYILETEDVAVLIKAQHFCVLTRGVEDTSGFTITSSVNGEFSASKALRDEFMNIVNSK